MPEADLHTSMLQNRFKLVADLEGDEKTGANVVLKALEAPLFRIAANAGLEGSVIINKVYESEPGIGFDALSEQYVDMVESGILDPAKVTRSALQNATSVASTLLTTESAVANIKEETPAAPAGRRNGNDVIPGNMKILKTPRMRSFLFMRKYVTIRKA